MMIALYSINLRIMDSPQISLMNDDTLKTQWGNIWDSSGIDGVLNGMLEGIGAEKLPATWGIVMIMLVVIFFIKFLTDYFLKTEVGLALRATDDHQRMIRSFSANTDILIILGIGLSNGLVALSGALIAQHGGFADAGMGIGMIFIGLASVIIGEALFGVKTIARATLAVIGGAIVYRIVVTLDLRFEFLDKVDMKLITALLVIIALITPKFMENYRTKKRRKEKRAKIESEEA